MSHPHTPATVLRQALTYAGLGVDPDTAPGLTTLVWPIYVGHLANKPDNGACVYDTSGSHQGRIMVTGETIIKPGWQIRVRATDITTAWTKIKEIQKFLDTIQNLNVTIGLKRYRILAVSQVGTPLSLGQEPDASRRDNITLNGTLTLKELN